MYLNSVVVVVYFLRISRLTLTWDVFKYEMWNWL